MGSIVLTDVEPYTIVAGIPAKKIRKRFDEDIVEALTQIKWCEKPLEWISSHADVFDNPRVFVESFYEKAGKSSK